jgi:phytoene dehydrogenase-like protein
MDTVQRWSKLDAEAYRREKSALVDRVTSHLEKLYPGFSDAVEMSDASTPLTIARYTRNPGGGIYGFAQTPDQTWIRRPDIRSPLPGLYFASAWSRPGGGFTGVMLSGHNAAREVAKGAAAGDETHHFEQRKAP